MLVHWIWLAHRSGVNDRMKAGLLRHFRDAEDIFFADGEALLSVEELNQEARASLADKDLSSAEAILEDCAGKDVHILTWQDAAYPVRLKNIPDPPVVLYYKGTLPEFDALPVIGVVGTRQASVYGLQTAKRMGYQIGKCGGILVSGMAKGIDAMAMAGALTAGQKTVGVLGCGADVVYPLSNRPLFRDVEQYGCLLSEFAPGTPPAKWNFPRRNRIISGLSCGVLVVEAPEKSGALITARLAADQGRDVFAVPGNIDVPSCVGSNRLLRDGAIMVSSGWDVLSEYEGQFPDKLCRDTTPSHQRVYPEEVAAQVPDPLPKVIPKAVSSEKREDVKKSLEKKGIDKAASSPYSDVNVMSRLSHQERQIVAALKEGPRLVDDVIAESGANAGQLLSALTMLELKGILKRLPGKRVILK